MENADFNEEKRLEYVCFEVVSISKPAEHVCKTFNGGYRAFEGEQIPLIAPCMEFVRPSSFPLLCQNRFDDINDVIS